MATVVKRHNKWQAQIRKKGSPSLSRTFHKRADAYRWAQITEVEEEKRGHTSGREQLSEIKLESLIKRYLLEIVPLKKGRDVERFRLRALARSKISKLSLAYIQARDFANYRDERLKRVKPATVKRELVMLQHILNVAKSEWGIPLPNNPVELIQKPPQSKPRKRRLNPGDYEALLNASRQSKAWHIWPLIELAIETGMRRGELLKATWDDLELQGRKLTLRDTKNGDDRTIPLTRKAVDILGSLPRTSERIFPVTPVAVRQAWERLRNRAGLRDLNFHDLRHEAISRFFEMGLSVPEVALISGHKDYRMLARYTHLRAEDVVGKLR
jgi:integrase